MMVTVIRHAGQTTPQNNPQSYINRKAAMDDDLFLVGLVNNETITSVIGGYEEHRGWVNYLAVNPQWQKTSRAKS